MCYELLESTILTVVLVPCRQRKIRCKLQDGDLQKRCENCSKRSKECVFRPVNQLDTVASGAQPSEVGAASVTSAQDTHSPPRPIAVEPLEDVDHRGQGFPKAPLTMAAVCPSLPYESGNALLNKEVLLPVNWTQNPSGWETDELHVFGIDNMKERTRCDPFPSSSFRTWLI